MRVRAYPLLLISIAEGKKPEENVRICLLIGRNIVSFHPLHECACPYKGRFITFMTPHKQSQTFVRRLARTLRGNFHYPRSGLVT